MQPILSSSYLGFGHGSLSRDTDEIGRLMEYLVCHHDAENFALVGHSTGCQNSIHFLKHGEKEMVERVKVCVLQAPVSDRESLTLSPGDHSAHMMHAKNLASQDKGEEMMPRDSFWAPITASRYISLFDVNGEDDFFSSDFSDEELRSRLGHVGAVGKNSGLRLLSVFSGKDEYVPSWVDKDVLLQRHLWAMNNLDDNFDKWQKGCNNENNLIAKGLVLMGANHNLSKGDGDIDQFVDAVGKLMKSATSNGVSMGH